MPQLPIETQRQMQLQSQIQTETQQKSQNIFHTEIQPRKDSSQTFQSSILDFQIDYQSQNKTQQQTNQQQHIDLTQPKALQQQQESQPSILQPSSTMDLYPQSINTNNNNNNYMFPSQMSVYVSPAVFFSQQVFQIPKFTHCCADFCISCIKKHDEFFDIFLANF